MVIQSLMVKPYGPVRAPGQAAPQRGYGARSRPEHHRVHDAAGHEGKEAGDHERAGKDGDHGVAMPADAMTPRVQDGERQHREGEDRE